MIEMCAPGLETEQCGWEGDAGRCVMIEFPEAGVQAITHGGLTQLNFPTRHEHFDSYVSDVTFRLADEVLGGMPNGTLFTQGLCVSLLGWLNTKYGSSAGRLAKARARPLSLVHRQRLTELIGGGLCSDLSLARLSEAVGISPYHFIRVFEATFGASPHRYVQEQRLHAAARALKDDTNKPIAEVALDHGFASQSHMTSLMRRRFGATPRQVRNAA